MSTLTDNQHLAERENPQQLLKDAWIKLEQEPLQAAGLACRAEHLARCRGDNRAWAESLFIWGLSILHDGNAHEALALFSRALAVYRFLDDEQGQWSCLKAIALAWGYTGDAAQAHKTHVQANAFQRNTEFTARAHWLRWFASR